MNTAPIALIPAEEVMRAISDLRSDLTRILADAAAAPETAEYLTFNKLRTLFGWSRGTCHKYLTAALSANKLRTISPRDANGTTGDTLYHVADFKRYLARLED